MRVAQLMRREASPHPSISGEVAQFGARGSG